MDFINDLPPLREIIERFGLQAKKSLGQNFLLDFNLTKKIVRAAGSLEGKTVLEIGPGPGGLTRAILAANPHQFIAIEQDEKCVEALKDLVLKAPFFHIVSGDALEIDFKELASPPFTVISNLPYNISTALLTRWLKNAPLFEELVLMFQKEVADRLIAKPDTKEYGRLSIVVQLKTNCKKVFDLPPQAFTPPPKVTSTVVKLTPYEKPLYPCDEEALEKITRAAFGQRRKMLRASLKQITPDTETLLKKAAIDPTRRAESLTVEEFCRLSLVYKNFKIIL
jgi:16S rRNA (adenine1518-N6/adenine1519-N6)-dimethyltransferase